MKITYLGHGTLMVDFAGSKLLVDPFFEGNPSNDSIDAIGDNFTMGYEDAAIAADFVVCDNIVGYHYDTFPPITIDKQAAIEHFKSADKSLQLPEVGASISF